MSIIKLKLSVIFLCSFVLTGIQAQEVIPASGGNASGSGGSASYSIGQVVYTTNTGITGSVAQGVQQPYEISVITGIEQAKDINLTYSAYPNPTTEFLTLTIDASTGSEQTTINIQSKEYHLFDINGKLLRSKKLTGIRNTIAMTNLVPAIYFLKITDNEQEIKTFKIIKN